MNAFFKKMQPRQNRKKAQKLDEQIIRILELYYGYTADAAVEDIVKLFKKYYEI